jgi:hypothetical protein
VIVPGGPGQRGALALHSGLLGLLFGVCRSLAIVALVDRVDVALKEVAALLGRVRWFRSIGPPLSETSPSDAAKHLLQRELVQFRIDALACQVGSPFGPSVRQ